jgi:hypothetical protein
VEDRLAAAFVVNLHPMSRVRYGLNAKWWNITIGEWMTLVLAFIGIVWFSAFSSSGARCSSTGSITLLRYAIRSSSVPRSPSQIPVPLPGNKIALLENGDEYFPAMLSAICSARTTIRGV